MSNPIIRSIWSALCTALLFVSTTFAQAGSEPAGNWLAVESPIAIQKMLANISPSDGAAGSVIASPQRDNPNYYFHWIRDSALIMDAVVTLYKTSNGSQTHDRYKQYLYQYVSFSRGNQVTQTQGGAGEPKFYVDGSAFNGPWGRPQSDGPALRALAMTRFANLLLDESQEDFVRSHLYDGRMPTQSLIKTDLEYISHQWRDSSFDIWEEVKGDHFYTRMVQRKALLKGAELANRLGDFGASSWYRDQANQIESSLQAFWNGSLLVPTINRVDGIGYKSSGVDSAVILGILHGYADDGFLSFQDPKVQATISGVESTFQRKYSINQRVGLPGIAIGRYPEDRYGGTDFNAGNPWVLATLALAEAHYRTEAALRQAGQNTQAGIEHDLADQYILRVKAHSNPDGSLSEQIHRDTGMMTSARDLSWNYAAVLTASWAHDGLKTPLEYR